MVGRQAAQYPEIVRRIVAEGHAIGHHSFGHHSPGDTSARELADEARRTRDLLTELLGVDVCLFRPPHGKLTTFKLLRLWRTGMQVALWNKDPKDFTCGSAQELARRLHEAPPRAGDVVLLHDRIPFAAETLPCVIKQARRDGLSFATVPEWMR